MSACSWTPCPSKWPQPAPWALTGKVDENKHRFATFEYDGSGRATSTENAQDFIQPPTLALAGTPGSTFTANPAPVNGKVTWPKDPSFSGTYFIQASNTMAIGSWINVPVNGTNPKDIGTSVEYTLPTGQSKLFTRLQVTPN